MRFRCLLCVLHVSWYLWGSKIWNFMPEGLHQLHENIERFMSWIAYRSTENQIYKWQHFAHHFHTSLRMWYINERDFFFTFRCGRVKILGWKWPHFAHHFHTSLCMWHINEHKKMWICINVICVAFTYANGRKETTPK